MQSADEPKQPEDNNSRQGAMKLRDTSREVILCVPVFEEERDSAAFRDGVLMRDIYKGEVNHETNEVHERRTSTIWPATSLWAGWRRHRSI